MKRKHAFELGPDDRQCGLLMENSLSSDLATLIAQRRRFCSEVHTAEKIVQKLSNSFRFLQDRLDAGGVRDTILEFDPDSIKALDSLARDIFSQKSQNTSRIPVLCGTPFGRQRQLLSPSKGDRIQPSILFDIGFLIERVIFAGRPFAVRQRFLQESLSGMLLSEIVNKRIIRCRFLRSEIR